MLFVQLYPNEFSIKHGTMYKFTLIEGQDTIELRSYLQATDNNTLKIIGEV